MKFHRPYLHTAIVCGFFSPTCNANKVFVCWGENAECFWVWPQTLVIVCVLFPLWLLALILLNELICQLVNNRESLTNCSTFWLHNLPFLVILCCFSAMSSFLNWLHINSHSFCFGDIFRAYVSLSFSVLPDLLVELNYKHNTPFSFIETVLCLSEASNFWSFYEPAVDLASIILHKQTIYNTLMYKYFVFSNLDSKPCSGSRLSKHVWREIIS